MRLLVCCEESQRVCSEFRKKGWESFSCDIQDCLGGHPEWHIKSDVLPLLNGFCAFTTCDGTSHYVSSEWDLIIAHPPCTFLSNAGAVRMFTKPGVVNTERLKNALAARSFFLKILNSNCSHICVENPVPLSIVGLPLKTQIIQPYFFGDPFSKKTYLWLKGLNHLKSTCVLSEHSTFVTKVHSAKIRSKTFPGIAAAMADQWSSFDDYVPGFVFDSSDQLVFD